MTGFRRIRRVLFRLARDAGATSAVEFALVATPLLFMLLGTMQVSLYYMTQSALDAGVNNAADYLRSQFASAAPTFPDASALKSMIVTDSGALIQNGATLKVDIQPLTNLDASAVAISDGVNNYGATTTATLVLRAQSSVAVFAPGFGSLADVRSSAVVRRKGA